MAGIESKQHVFCHGGSGNSVDDPTTRGRPKCRFSTGTGNSFDTGNPSSWTGTYRKK